MMNNTKDHRDLGRIVAITGWLKSAAIQIEKGGFEYFSSLQVQV
jgi:hypothetical protein